RVWAQLAGSGGLGNSIMNGNFDLDLVHADRAMDMECRHSRVLADGLHTIRRHIDVLVDNRQRLFRLRAVALRGSGPSHYAPDVRGKIRGCLGNEIKETCVEVGHLMDRLAGGRAAALEHGAWRTGDARA